MARQIVKEHGFKQPPVLPEAIAKAERLEVLKVMTWPDALSGLLLRESRRIGINGNHARVRQRFSLAHELGHWFLRHDLPWLERDVTIDEPPELGAENERYQAQESEANEFAGELLAPREMLKAGLRTNRDINKLSQYFDMSAEALWVRVLRHNLLT